MTTQLDVFFSAAVDGVCLCRKDRDDVRFVDANPSFLRMSGYTRRELLSLSPLSVFAEGGSPFLPAHRERLASEEELSTEIQLTGKNGVLMDVEMSIKRNFDQQHRAVYLIIVRDMSDFRWIHNQRFEYGIACSLTSGLFITRLTNKTDQSFLAQGQWESQPFLRFVSPGTLEQTRSLLYKAIRSGSAQNSRTVLLHNNKELAVKLFVQPLWNGSGDLTRLALLAADKPAVEASDPGATLRMLMAEQQITATRLAQLTGLSIGTISKIRNGKIPNPHRFSIQCIADVLNVKAVDIWRFM
jgi:PAS domain S-box-containing protein